MRKMLRDIKDNRGSYLACLVVITIGLMVFTSFALVMDNLNLSRDSFYFHQNFADGFAEVRAMPYGEAEKLRNIEGIRDLQGRLVKDVRALLPGREENIYLRLVSIDPKVDYPVNGVHLERGVALDEERLNIWIDNKFLEANQLSLNDTIEIIAEGKKRNLTINGVGLSPEFIYALRTAGELFPNPAEFGIAFIPYEAMKSLFQEQGTVNSIVFTIQAGSSYEEVEDRLKPELKPYGLTSIYSREDQSSHVLISAELEQLKTMGTSLPVLFVGVASVILYIMLKRMIENQRSQIGVLKALGYSNQEVVAHYMSYALTVGLGGGVIGGLLGIALAQPLTSMYALYFNMPDLRSGFSPEVLFQGVLLGLAFSAFAGYRGCRKILILEPAEAMRPGAPPAGKSILLERVAFFWQMLNVQGKMAVRNLFRQKGRSVFVLVGIMFSFALVGVCWSMWETTEQMMYDQFEKVEVYNLKITLNRPSDQAGAERELSRFPGVKRVESKAEIPATLKNNWREKDVVILGLPQDGQLHKILDKQGRQLAPPIYGIMISERLAELLDARVGTRVVVESVMAKDPAARQEVEVTAIIPQFMGVNAYMEINSLQSMLKQGPLATTLMVTADEGAMPLLRAEYQNSAAISVMEDRNKMLQALRDLMATYSGTIYILLLIGVVVGFAIIYNSSVITVSERSRELASMMVLGMTPAEVLSVITFEQWFISIFGMLLGIPLTKLLLVGMAQSLSNDLYSMPSSFGGMTIVIGSIITVASIWVAQRAAAGKIRALKIADVLKAGE
jgi:putative ABC transport system permease protein